MRMLWVKVNGLWPLNTGGRRRTFHMLSELARRHEIVFVTTHGLTDDEHDLADALPHCQRVVSLPYSAPKHGDCRFAQALLRSWLSTLPVDLLKWRVGILQRTIRSLISTGSFDVVIADFLFAAVNIPLNGPVPVVLFEHNVEYVIWKRLSHVQSHWWRRLLMELEWRKMRRIEANTCEASTMTIAVSDDDREHLARQSPKATIVSVQTGVDLDYFQPRDDREVDGRLVFTGSMDWYPNKDAMLYFVKDVLPRIRARIPNVSVEIVGRTPGPEVQALASGTEVQVTGTVDDIRPHVAQAAAYIVPLRIGGGTRLKIFEALAMGKAVVSTHIGAEGLNVVSGLHLVLATGVDDFSDAVVQLLRDAKRRKALGGEGRHLVETRYSWATVARTFETHLQAAVTTHR